MAQTKPIKENRTYMASQSTQLSSVSRTTRGSSASKRTRFSKNTTTSQALRKVRKQRKQQMVAFPMRQPFPAQLVTTLRYVDTQANLGNGAGYNWVIYSCNSLYDPDRSGTGHQPMYFDQLMSIYNHYTVIKSKIKISSMPGTTQYSFPITHTVCIDDDATVSATTASTLQERPGAVSKTFIPYAEGSAGGTITKYWNSGFTFPGDALARDELQGTASSSPAEESFYICQFDGGVGLVTTTYGFRIEIEYTAVFDEWKSMTQS